MKNKPNNGPATEATVADSGQNPFSENIVPPVGEGIQIEPAAEEASPPASEYVPPAPAVPTRDAQVREAIAAPTRHASLDGPIVKELLTDLKTHPLSVAIFGTGCSDELTQSVRQNGMLQPLLVHRITKYILAGNSRAEAARQLGMVEVPVTYFDSTDALEIEAAVLESNKMRVKTEEQKAREFTAWQRIEAERAKLRMATNAGGQGMKTFPEAEKGTARDKAAEKVGMSGVTAQKSAAVVAAIDELETGGKKEEATELRKVLNEESVNAAHKVGKARGHVKTKKKSKRTAPPSDAQATKKPDPELDEAHQKGTAHADDAIKFLKTKEAANLSIAQRKEWEKIGSQIAQCLKRLGLKAA